MQEQQRILQQEQQRQQQERGAAEAQVRRPSGESLKKEEAVPATESEKCFQITRIILDGATHLAEAERTELSAPYLGRCIGLGEINDLIRAITNHYVAQGYTTTRVYIPEQDLSRGDLRILVLEGLVDKILLEGEGVSVGNAFPGLEGRIFNLRDFEQGLDQVNRLQSNSATMDIAPAEQPGMSNVIVRNQPGKPWALNFAVDNTGTDATGYYQASATLGLDNLLQQDEFLSLSARTNADQDKKRKLSRSYSGLLFVPYGYWTLSGSASEFEYVSIVKGLVSDFRSSGISRTQTLKLDRVLHRDQSRKWSLSAAFARKDNRNFLNDSLLVISSRTLAVFDLDSNLSINALGGLWSFDLGLARGLNNFGALEDAPGLPKAAPRAQFTKLKYGANYMRSFKIGETNFSWQSSLNGQYAKDVLYGTEQISIGGPYSVRGFREFNISGDSGLVWRNEIGTPLPLAKLIDEAAPTGTLRPYLGVDIGHVQDKYGIAGGTLAGVTVGLVLTVQRASLQMAYSAPVHTPDRFQERDRYAYLRLAIDF